MCSHDGDAGAGAAPDPTADGGGLEREDLRRELELRERERAELVRRYERLLDERDERIEELRDSESARTLRGRLRNLLGRGS